jgi:agmatine deiminase
MKNGLPKDLGFHMPAEWHVHQACWMAWPCHVATWALIGLPRARQVYARIANAIAQYEPVNMLVSPEHLSTATELCGANIHLIPLPLNDSWTRDTGPTFLLNTEHELAGIHWIHNAWGGNYPDCDLDKQIASTILDKSHARQFNAPFVMEGGSFHVDGDGTVLTTKECLLNKNRNPQLSMQEIEEHLCQYLGANKVIWLEKGLIGDETDGHVDEIATFLAPGKVLALITHDKQDENYAILQKNLEILHNSMDAKGRQLEVWTVNLPPATYIDGQRLTLSYVNFYLANQGIVMPAFGYPDYDKAAYQLFRQLFPDHAITQVDASDLFAGGGGIHCITQQEPSIHSLVNT